jgi:hypothetical protein
LFFISLLDEILVGVRQLLRDREQGPAGTLLRVRPGMQLQDLWDKLLTAMRSKNPSIASGLGLAIPLGAENGVLRLAFPDEDTPTMQALMRADNREFIEATVSDMLGVPYRLECNPIRPHSTPKVSLVPPSMR